MKIKRGRERGREESECYCSVIQGVGEIARMWERKKAKGKREGWGRKGKGKGWVRWRERQRERERAGIVGERDRD